MSTTKSVNEVEENENSTTSVIHCQNSLKFCAMTTNFRGNRVSAIREALGWTQTDLAVEIRRRFPDIRISPQSISLIETDNRNPSMDVAIAIAIVLETSLDYLSGITDHDRGLNGHDEVTVVVREQEQKTDLQMMCNPFLLLSAKDRKMVVDLTLRLSGNVDTIDTVSIQEKRFRRVIESLSEKLGIETVRDIASGFGVSV